MIGVLPYRLAVYRETLVTLWPQIHPTATHACRLHLEQAIRSDANGDEAEVLRRLTMIETRIEAELDWLDMQINEANKRKGSVE
jgi:hypothetical protein